MNPDREGTRRVGPLALALGLVALLHAALGFLARELHLLQGIDYGWKWPLASLYAVLLPYAIAALALQLGRKRPEGAAGALLGGGLVLGAAYSLAGGADGAKAWGAAYYGLSAVILLSAWDGWRSGGTSASTRNALLQSLLFLGLPFVLDAFIDGRALPGELAAARERLSQAQMPRWTTAVPAPTAAPSVATAVPAAVLVPTAQPTAVPTPPPKPTPVPTPRAAKHRAHPLKHRHHRSEALEPAQAKPSVPGRLSATSPEGLRLYVDGPAQPGGPARLSVVNGSGKTLLTGRVASYQEAWFSHQGCLMHRNGSRVSAWRPSDGQVLLDGRDFPGQDLGRWEPWFGPDGHLELASRSGLQRRQLPAAKP
jgi:hypothetical protein